MRHQDQSPQHGRHLKTWLLGLCLLAGTPSALAACNGACTSIDSVTTDAGGFVDLMRRAASMITWEGDQITPDGLAALDEVVVRWKNLNARPNSLKITVRFKVRADRDLSEAEAKEQLKKRRAALSKALEERVSARRWNVN